MGQTSLKEHQQIELCLRIVVPRMGQACRFYTEALVLLVIMIPQKPLYMDKRANLVCQWATPRSRGKIAGKGNLGPTTTASDTPDRRFASRMDTKILSSERHADAFRRRATRRESSAERQAAIPATLDEYPCAGAHTRATRTQERQRQVAVCGN